MLRKIRIILGALFFLLITLMFLDFTGTFHHWLSWMAKIQFIPAILAMNLIVVAILLVITLVFGRIYCSIICPMGVFQDVVARLHRKKKQIYLLKASSLVALFYVRYICRGFDFGNTSHLWFDISL